MTYDEYLICAEKHLKGCASLLSSYKAGQKHDKHVWLELYYLSGYIIEGVVVYSAYKQNNWPQNEDIRKRWNLEFTKQTNLDFFYNRKIKDREEINRFYQNRTNGLSVQGHRFQDIVKSLLRPDPSFNNVPYVGNGQIDPDVEQLIEDWKPDVRYVHDRSSATSLKLSHDLIDRLINTCFTIYSQHI